MKTITVSILQTICLASSCQPLHDLPLVLCDDFTLSVMRYHSSREAASKSSNLIP